MQALAFHQLSSAAHHIYYILFKLNTNMSMHFFEDMQRWKNTELIRLPGTHITLGVINIFLYTLENLLTPEIG